MRFQRRMRFFSSTELDSISKDIIDRRNSVEHPNGKLGPMRIQNTQIACLDEGIKLIEPLWALGDGKFSSILQDMYVFINNCRLPQLS